ncbi:acyl-CoA thioesterase [Chryseobacterium gotjawalense]|uniref:Acyl-CoA thioesterase n=1 Tax=Chryseobacterium gotjawalense TaxID=3042315 RepID=A0ABY8RG03_9FLAO|nr:acyl-CoA thioesterase [Chryseobacterium sp. wdc7]WHF52113.1 acyl-CoA thioesterase [Chryseobacterium sp. wdc7]
MNYEEKIQNSETRVFKVVFPNITNHHNTMFGGTVMEMMDEVAFMTATRFARKSFVTVSCDRIDFKKPIPADTLVELIGRVKYVGNSSLKVNIEVYVEQMYDEIREKAVSGDFTLVAIGPDKKPVKIFEREETTNQL